MQQQTQAYGRLCRKCKQPLTGYEHEQRLMTHMGGCPPVPKQSALKDSPLTCALCKDTGSVSAGDGTERPCPKCRVTEQPVACPICRGRCTVVEEGASAATVCAACEGSGIQA